MKTPRRSISVSGHTYERARVLAEREGVGIARITTLALESWCDKHGVGKISEVDAKEMRKERAMTRMAEARVAVSNWNAEHPRGTNVRYRGQDDFTTSPAFIAGGHACVMLGGGKARPLSQLIVVRSAIKVPPELRSRTRPAPGGGVHEF